MASSEAKNLVRHYLNKIEEWENISDSEDSKRANYMFWKKEFFTRINDLELATDRFDNQFWIKALKARIKEMHDAMSSLHYLRDDMRAAYDDIKKVEEQLEAYGMEDYVTGDVRMGSLNEVEFMLPRIPSEALFEPILYGKQLTPPPPKSRGELRADLESLKQEMAANEQEFMALVDRVNELANFERSLKRRLLADGSSVELEIEILTASQNLAAHRNALGLSMKKRKELVDEMLELRAEMKRYYDDDSRSFALTDEIPFQEPLEDDHYQNYAEEVAKRSRKHNYAFKINKAKTGRIGIYKATKKPNARVRNNDVSSDYDVARNNDVASPVYSNHTVIDPANSNPGFNGKFNIFDLLRNKEKDQVQPPEVIEEQLENTSIPELSLIDEDEDLLPAPPLEKSSTKETPASDEPVNEAELLLNEFADGVVKSVTSNSREERVHRDRLNRLIGMADRLRNSLEKQQAFYDQAKAHYDEAISTRNSKGFNLYKKEFFFIDKEVRKTQHELDVVKLRLEKLGYKSSESSIESVAYSTEKIKHFLKNLKVFMKNQKFQKSLYEEKLGLVLEGNGDPELDELLDEDRRLMLESDALNLSFIRSGKEMLRIVVNSQEDFPTEEVQLANDALKILELSDLEFKHFGPRESNPIFKVRRSHPRVFLNKSRRNMLSLRTS